MPLGCQPAALITNSRGGGIADSSLSASSSKDAYHGPARSRLNTMPSGRLAGAWAARYANTQQWIQVHLTYF